jgi:hypothetical protein
MIEDCPLNKQAIDDKVVENEFERQWVRFVA